MSLYEQQREERKVKPNTLFVYGILKRGLELDLEHYAAKFIGEAYIPGAVLYGIGRKWHHESHPNDGQEFHGVGLKLNAGPLRVARQFNDGMIGYEMVDVPAVAHGEVWEIPDTLWDWLDSIEQNGHCYTRKVVKVLRNDCGEAGEGIVPYDAWVYEYTHPYFEGKNPIESGRF